jgi:hypothetical protein
LKIFEINSPHFISEKDKFSSYRDASDLQKFRASSLRNPRAKELQNTWINTTLLLPVTFLKSGIGEDVLTMIANITLNNTLVGFSDEVTVPVPARTVVIAFSAALAHHRGLEQ